VKGRLTRALALFAATVVLVACRSDASGPSPSAEAGPTAAPWAAPSTAPTPQTAVQPAPSPSPVEAATRPDVAPLSFAPLAKRANPAVATVKSRIDRLIRGRSRTVAEGLGTAFVYDPSGHLLTNNHVIEDATEVTVDFLDGREVVARVVGRDKHTDIAVLAVDAKDLPSLPLGDSDALEVGDWVVAIGNPFGLSHTVSAGILSAKGRTTDDIRDLDPSGYFNFLQTDASINPGNSGGPLLNLKGEVVGINTAVRENANGIGFAIPINMVKQLLPVLLREGKITRSALGVGVDALGATQAELLRRPDRKGVWVKYVLPGGPAERAGIAANDVILAFDGQPVTSPSELRWAASIAGVGRSVSIRVARMERTFDVKVTLGILDNTDEPR
jgi:serine protease Do